MKPKELKPKEAKPIKYNDYFIKGLDEIQKNKQPIDFNDLQYNFKGPGHAPINFIKFKGPNHIFKSIHDGDIALEDVEKEQIKVKSDLGLIKQGPWRYKSPEQIQAIRNIENPITQEKKLPKCSIIMLRICLEIFMSQKKEHDLKY